DQTLHVEGNEEDEQLPGRTTVVPDSLDLREEERGCRGRCGAPPKQLSSPLSLFNHSARLYGGIASRVNASSGHSRTLGEPLPQGLRRAASSAWTGRLGRNAGSRLAADPEMTRSGCDQERL